MNDCGWVSGAIPRAHRISTPSCGLDSEKLGRSIDNPTPGRPICSNAFQVSVSMLVCVKDVFNWYMEGRFRFSRSRLPLESSPNTMIYWSLAAGKRCPLLMMRSSQLLRKILWSLVCLNRCRRLISHRYEVQASQAYRRVRIRPGIRWFLFLSWGDPYAVWAVLILLSSSLSGEIIWDGIAKLGEFIDDFYQLSLDVNVHVRCCLFGSRMDLSLFYTDLTCIPKCFWASLYMLSDSLVVNDSLVPSCIVRQHTKILAREWLYSWYENEVGRICTGYQCQYWQEVLGSVSNLPPPPV